MIVVHHVAAPKGYHEQDSDPECITVDEIESALKGTEAQEVWLWYSPGRYAGSGQMLMRGNAGWDCTDLGHCSCYGPLDGVKFKPQTLTALRAAYSDEAWKDVAPLVLAATGRKAE